MSLTLPGSGLGRLPPILDRLSLAGAAIGAMVRSLRNRRRAFQVADLPDHLLSDIGLKRDDIHTALNTHWRQDPTYVLATRARENRCSR